MNDEHEKEECGPDPQHRPGGNDVGPAYGDLCHCATQAGAGASQAELTIIYTPPWLMVFALLFSALIGVISGIYPALRAANLSPLMAIKYE